MTLGQILALALRQLDEDAEDVSEYESVFRVYANAAYRIAVVEFLKPREERHLFTDAQGVAPLGCTGIVRVVSLRKKGEGGEETVGFVLSEDGRRVCTTHSDAELTAMCEVEYPEMEAVSDKPRLPESVHGALADYICYRHLSDGGEEKQKQAQHYLRTFYQAMQRLRPDGFGSVTRFKNLYAVTDVRYGQ